MIRGVIDLINHPGHGGRGGCVRYSSGVRFAAAFARTAPFASAPTFPITAAAAAFGSWSAITAATAEAAGPAAFTRALRSARRHFAQLRALLFGQDFVQAGANFLLQRFEVLDLLRAQGESFDQRRRQDLPGPEHRRTALRSSGAALAKGLRATFAAFRSAFTASFSALLTAFGTSLATLFTGLAPLRLARPFFGSLSKGQRSPRQAAGGESRQHKCS